MLPRLRILLLTVTIASCAHSVALPRAPAPLAIEGRLLSPRSDTLAVFLIRGADTVRTGAIVDQVEVSDNRLIRVYAMTDRVFGNGLDTIVSSLPDLRPLLYHTRSGLRTASVSFNAAHARGWAKPGNRDSTVVALDLPPGTYDGVSFDLVLRASPLREGLALNVPSFLVDIDSVRNLSATVTGSANVDGQDCWRVDADFAGTPVSFWIDKGTRILRRQVMQLRPGVQVLFAHAKAGGTAGGAPPNKRLEPTRRMIRE